MRSLRGSTARASLRSRALPQLQVSTFGRQRTALPLFVGTRSLQVPCALESRSSRGVYLSRQYSSGARGGNVQLGAPKFSLSFGSVLLASTLGAMVYLSQRVARAKENTSNNHVDDKEKDEDEEEKQKKEDFVHYLLERPILLLLLEREDVDEKLDKNLDEIMEDEELKAVHLLDYMFFSSDKSKFPTNATALIYHYNQKTKQVETYVYPADLELTADNVKQFLADIKEHKLEELRYHPSEPRPTEDKHPAVKHLKVVTAESFKDMVLDSDKDVLVYLHIPSTTTPTDLQVLASTYAGKDDVVVAECTSFLNELDPTYFGDTPIEGIKLFVKGHKQTPITYHGKGDLLDIVAFVEAQRGADGEQLYRQLRKADATRMMQDFEKTLGDYYLHNIAYKEFVPVSEKAKGLFNRLFDMYDQINASDDPFKMNAGTLKKQLRDELKSLEHATLRNVKLVDKEKYREELAEARKKGEVVVFFWRKGCWPCKKLSPMIGQLSLDFPEVTFLKVDADAEGLNATPTFFVYREEDDQPSELSGMKLITHLHPLARKRGLPGYAKWLPPAERVKLVEPSPDEIERSSEEVPTESQENNDKEDAKTDGQQDEEAAPQEHALAPTDDEVTPAAAAASTSGPEAVESLQMAELPHHQHHQ